MEIYLAIITTVLVCTQIIRVTQNAIQLKRQWECLTTEPNKQLVDLWDKIDAAVDIYLKRNGEAEDED